MTEEEYFRKNYPDACYGERPLSPYWDFFQDGVEFGERQSETKIEELEKENLELRNNGFTVSAMTEQQLKAAIEKGEQLEKENEELKHNKKTVAHLADCLEEKMKERIEELEKENTELKAHIKADCIDCADYIKIKKLEEENAEIKAELKDANEKVVHLACNQNKDLKQQLTKAKEIIKGLLSCCRNYPQENAEKMEQAEQFLKEIEKC